MNRRSNTTKVGKESKLDGDQGNLNLTQQLQQISAKLAKLDELEKLNRDFLGQLLQLSHRVTAVTVENRLLKQEIEDLKQERLQEEVLIKGFKLQNPNHHQEVFRKVCDVVGSDAAEAVKEVRPLVFKQNKKTDAVLVKFRRVEDKSRFIQRVRALKRPVTPGDLNIKSTNKFVLIQDHLTPEKQRVHRLTWDLCKLGLQRPWFYKGSTWITHPETKKRFRVADSKDVEEVEFILVTQGNGSSNPINTQVTVSED